MNVDEIRGSFRENGGLEQTKTGNSSLCEVEAQRCCASGVGVNSGRWEKYGIYIIVVSIQFSIFVI